MIIRLLRSVARTLIPAAARRYLGMRYNDWLVARSPDRAFIKGLILPALGRRRGKLLFVGCKRYTAGYPAIINTSGSECFTIDIDPRHAKWGAPGRHSTLDVRDLATAFAPGFFDTIVLNGVFDYGVDTPEMKEAALAACHEVLRDGGVLVLGWDRVKNSDPRRLPGMSRFRAARLDGLEGAEEFISPTTAFYFCSKP